LRPAANGSARRAWRAAWLALGIAGPAAAQPAEPAIANPAVRAAVQVHRQGQSADAEQRLRALAGQDSEAAAWLAVVLLERGAPPAEAVRLLQRAATAGNAEAQHQLAFLYATGRGVPADERRAAELFTQAAQQNHGRAAANLGTLYAQGRGVPVDPAQAKSWYERAAAAGDPYGAFALARLIENEPRMQARAAEIYRQAADRGHLGASLRLGRMLADGKGIGRDTHAAQARLRHAASNGLPEAALALGDLIAQMIARGEGPGGSEAAARQAAQWYRQAADAGIAAAQFKLGNAYFAGAGVPRDFAQAQGWYQRAAQQGYVDAQYTLGIWLSGGVGGRTEPVEGQSWLLLAERAGNPDAGLVRTRGAEKLSPAQIKEAEAMAVRFVPKQERRPTDPESLPLKPPPATP
jgi:TPR repeat protein